MAIGDTKKVRQFVFENSNGRCYRVTLFADGTGRGRLLGKTKESTPEYANTDVALTVDAGSLATFFTWKVSRLSSSAVFNTSQALNAVLNAAAI